MGFHQVMTIRPTPEPDATYTETFFTCARLKDNRHKTKDELKTLETQVECVAP